MMKISSVVPMVLAASLLGGCQTFSVLGLSKRGPDVAPALAEAETDAITQQGRDQLAKGQVGLAVETFRVALALGEAQAPALNGLGVAYARLGRPDAAEQLFAKALQLDPANPRYVANLERLSTNRELARGDARPSANPSDSPALIIPAQSEFALNRVSPREVTVHALAIDKAAGAPGVAEVRAQSRGPLATKTSNVVRSVPSDSAPKSIVSASFRPLVRIPLQSPLQARVSALTPRVQNVATASKAPNRNFAVAFEPIVRMEFGASETNGRRKVVLVAAADGRSL